MGVKIIVPSNSPVVQRGWRGYYFLQKAMRRGRFSFSTQKGSTQDVDKIVEVEKGAHQHSWDLASFFTPETCQSLADRFHVGVMVDCLGYTPSKC
jgi:hypothetical protein